jgi:hypothetical protein
LYTLSLFIRDEDGNPAIDRYFISRRAGALTPGRKRDCKKINLFRSTPRLLYSVSRVSVVHAASELNQTQNPAPNARPYFCLKIGEERRFSRLEISLLNDRY